MLRPLLLVALAVAVAGVSRPAAADGFPITKISKVKTKGAHSVKALTKQLRGVSDHLGDCKANDPSIAKKLTIAFQIAADGSVSIINPDAGAEPGACFGKALARMTFPPQQGLSLVTFVATFVPTKSRKRPDALDAITEADAARFADMLVSEDSGGSTGDMSRGPGADLNKQLDSGGGAGAVATSGGQGGTASKGVRVSIKDLTGARSASAVAGRLPTYRDQVAACYRDVRAGALTDDATADVTLAISAKGTVTATLAKDHKLPAALAACARAGAAKLEFPAASGTASATVTLTFAP